MLIALGKVAVLFFIGYGLFNYTEPAFTSHHYVHKNSTGRNDGSSWKDAWKSFPDINWEKISPGDIIYISGGPDSTIYHELLDINRSGSPDGYITVRNGLDPEHNGRVIIDGGGIRRNIIVYKNDYVKILGFEIRNGSKKLSGMIDLYSAHHTLIDSCKILSDGKHAGIHYEFCSHGTASRNYIYTPDYSTHQTDGIYSQKSSHMIYEWNYITVSNNNNIVHTDAIQTLYNYSDIARYNTIILTASDSSNSQGIFFEKGSGLPEIYGNSVWGSASRFMLAVINNGDGTIDTTKIFNNTIYQGKGATNGSVIIDVPKVYYKNNIVWTEMAINYPRRKTHYIIMKNWDLDASNIDNNIFFAGSGQSVIFWTVNNNSYNYKEWVSILGCDSNGYNQNPLFKDVDNKDLTLLSNSLGIDNGEKLGRPYNLAINNFNWKQKEFRPLGDEYDIGAYER